MACCSASCVGLPFFEEAARFRHAGLAEEAVARLERLQEACDEQRGRAEAAAAAAAENEVAVVAAQREGEAAVARAQEQVGALQPSLWPVYSIL